METEIGIEYVDNRNRPKIKNQLKRSIKKDINLYVINFMLPKILFRKKFDEFFK